jgi:hypothetical protein
MFGLLDGIIQKTSINGLCVLDGAVLIAAAEETQPQRRRDVSVD